jgi:hypothetical protein
MGRLYFLVGVYIARIEENVEIKRSVEKVFAYTTEANSWPSWQSIIREAEQTSPGTMCVGAMFKGTSRMMGISMKWTGKVTEYESNKNWAKNISYGSMIIEEHVTYDPTKEGVKFTIVYDVRAGGFLKLFSPIVINSMRKETQKSLNNLKNIFESQT